MTLNIQQTHCQQKHLGCRLPSPFTLGGVRTPFTQATCTGDLQQPHFNIQHQQTFNVQQSHYQHSAPTDSQYSATCTDDLVHSGQRAFAVVHHVDSGNSQRFLCYAVDGVTSGIATWWCTTTRKLLRTKLGGGNLARRANVIGGGHEAVTMFALFLA